MARRRYTAEQIIGFLRQAEVMVGLVVKKVWLIPVSG